MGLERKEGRKEGRKRFGKGEDNKMRSDPSAKVNKQGNLSFKNGDLDPDFIVS